MLNENTIRVAIVEDDEDDFLIIKDYISEIEGNNFVVDWHNDYDAAIEAIKKKQYNIYRLASQKRQKAGDSRSRPRRFLCSC